MSHFFKWQNCEIELPGSLLICQTSGKPKLIGIAIKSEVSCQNSITEFKKYYPLDNFFRGEWYQEFIPTPNVVKKHLKPVWSRTKLNLVENISPNHLISYAYFICIFIIFFWINVGWNVYPTQCANAYMHNLSNVEEEYIWCIDFSYITMHERDTRIMY